VPATYIINESSKVLFIIYDKYLGKR